MKSKDTVFNTDKQNNNYNDIWVREEESVESAKENKPKKGVVKLTTHVGVVIILITIICLSVAMFTLLKEDFEEEYIPIPIELTDDRLFMGTELIESSSSSLLCIHNKEKTKFSLMRYE